MLMQTGFSLVRYFIHFMIRAYQYTSEILTYRCTQKIKKGLYNIVAYFLKARIVKPPETADKDDGVTPGPARTLPGNHLGRAALRRAQRELLESNHRENRVTGKDDEADQRRLKHSSRSRRNDCTPIGYSGGIVLRRGQCCIFA
jgi:hypothetical protein